MRRNRRLRKGFFLLGCLIALAALGGCGTAAPAETAEAAPAASPEAWGVSGAASIQPALQQRQVEEVTSEQEPEPETEPEPLPASLREVIPESVTVWLDGTAAQGLLLDGKAMVEAGDLAARWSWFRGSGDTKTWTFTGDPGDRDAGASELPCVPPEQFSGTECVYFAGTAEEYWIPAEWVAQCFGCSYLQDPETQAVYLSPCVDVEDIPTDVAVPILMYHAVSDDLWGIEELFVSPEDMRAQLEYLIDNGYDPIFFSDLPHLSDYDRPVILTFDDGYDDNYTELLPLLREYNVKATVFVITGMLGDEHYLTAEQAREMSESGLVDIQSHTVNHPELDTLSYDEQKQELAGSRLELARITGRIPYVIAYPSGSRNDDTLTLAPEYYSLGVDMNGGLWYTGESWFKVDRIYISRWDTLDDFAGVLP